MATEHPIYVDSSKNANGDLSALQYKFVKETANGIEAVAAVTDKPAGVLQNDPKDGENAQVMKIGKSKLKLGGTVTVAAALGPDADGDGVALTIGTDTTKYVGATAGEAGASGEIISAYVNCITPSRAA